MDNEIILDMYLDDQFKTTQNILDTIRQINSNLEEKDLNSNISDIELDSEESYPSTIKKPGFRNNMIYG